MRTKIAKICIKYTKGSMIIEMRFGKKIKIRNNLHDSLKTN